MIWKSCTSRLVRDKTTLYDKQVEWFGKFFQFKMKLIYFETILLIFNLTKENYTKCGVVTLKSNVIRNLIDNQRNSKYLISAMETIVKNGQFDEKLLQPQSDSGKKNIMFDRLWIIYKSFWNYEVNFKFQLEYSR